MKLLVLIVATIVLTLTTPAWAKAGEFAIGVVVGPVRFGACDTEEQLRMVLTAHQGEGGVRAAKATFQQLMEMPGAGGRACGAVHGFVALKEVIFAGPLPFENGDLPTVFARADVMIRSGAVVELWVFLHNSRVVPADELGKVAI